MTDRKERPSDDEGWRDIHLDDVLKGVSTFITLVSDVVETVGSRLNQPRPYEVRTLAPAQPASPARLAAGAAIAGLRDPIVDLFDEGEEIVLVVEWPYVDEGPIQIDVEDDVLSLSIGGARPYTADVLLPGVVDAATLRQTCRNGITEVRLKRA